jgi:hypothetical protein
MANYAAETPTEQGLAPTARTPVNGDTVPGGCTLYVKNTNAAILTMTITTPKSVHGDLAVGDRVVTVPATTGERFFAVPNDDTYVDPLTGLVTIATWSVTSGVTYYVLRGV